MDRRPGILKVLRSVSEPQLDPSPEESLFTSGMLDSFALTDFISGLETEFNVKIPDADFSARKFDTVAKVEQYLDARAG